MDTLVIGDVHGHYDRLEALLKQEGIIGECGSCEGTGDGALEGGFCEICDGDGIARINRDVKVIQLGDLAHNGSGRRSLADPASVPGNATADMLCWDAVVRKHWCDIVLWGNHDAAVVDESHTFGGYIPPRPETEHLMMLALAEDRLKLAYETDGFLLTHAGLHKVFKHQKDVPDEIKTDSMRMAHWLNRKQEQDVTDGLDFGTDAISKENTSFVAVRDAIGKNRGGSSDAGGILWRDANENLYTGYRQIFGHTKGPNIRKYETPKGWSYCIDVGDQFNGHLAGIWLPDERIVEVKL